MRAELEEKLGKAFPFMERKNSLAKQQAEGYIGDLFGAFGCDVDDGWYRLIYDMCQEITDLYRSYHKEIDIVPTQVKEKFGTLRFYHRFGGREESGYEELHRKVEDVVSKYEDKSGSVCEQCGDVGKLRDDRGWIRALCDKHAAFLRIPPPKAGEYEDD